MKLKGWFIAKNSEGFYLSKKGSLLKCTGDKRKAIRYRSEKYLRIEMERRGFEGVVYHVTEHWSE